MALGGRHARRRNQMRRRKMLGDKLWLKNGWRKYRRNHASSDGGETSAAERGKYLETTVIPSR